MPRSFLVATFSDPDDLMQAVYAVRKADFRIYDVYAPCPIHGLDQAMGIRRTRLPWITLVIGSSALLFAVLFQFYTTVLDWPLNVGGKPDNSTLAFIPITFELTVLLGGLATVAALLARAQLYPGKKEALVAGGVTNDTFALVLRKRDPFFNTKHACELLERCNASRIEEKESDL
jgi:Protein of unknown function (DUF3341)